MPKKIVVCCDGTGNEFESPYSNVMKLYMALVRDERQVAYYQPGVGTMGARNAPISLTEGFIRWFGRASGYGIVDNIMEAYVFLMRYFEPGDQLYVFGFSRGAYTARALCGILCALGLLVEPQENLVPYAIRTILRSIRFTSSGLETRLEVDAMWKLTFTRECKPHFVGVWDTVGSLGYYHSPRYTLNFPFTRATTNPDFQIVRHALSIDERRASFPPHFFGPPNHNMQDVLEVWFAGVHADVGGGYVEAESELSKITLRWMLAEAEIAGLLVDQTMKAAILGGEPPDPTTKNQHEELRGLWWLAEAFPKVEGVLNAKGKWVKRVRFNLGRRRDIPAGALFHESVQQRLSATNICYRPSNVPPSIPPPQIVYDR